MERINLKPLSLGEILLDTIKLYFMNFPIIFILICLISLPIAGLINYFPDAVGISTDTKGMALANLTNSAFSFILVPLVYLAIAPIISGNMIGVKVKVITSLKVLYKNLGKLIITGIIAYFLILIGLAFLVIPGIILLMWFLLLPLIISFEDVTFIQALQRGRQLLKGYFIKFFLVMCGVSAIFFGVTMLVMPLVTTIQGITVDQTFFIYTVLQALLYPIFGCALTLMYIDLKIRKESFDTNDIKNFVESY